MPVTEALFTSQTKMTKELKGSQIKNASRENHQLNFNLRDRNGMPHDSMPAP